MAELDLSDEVITYRAFIERFNSKFVLSNKQHLVKFAFDLFDNDSNGVVCLKDLQTFSLHFGGLCDILMTDFRTLMDYLRQKRRRVIADEKSANALKQRKYNDQVK
jgi:hypothetical protein